MLVLTEKLADIHAQLFDYAPRLTEEDYITFIKTEFSRIGADKAITPREVIRDFIELLNIIYQNPDIKVNELLSSGDFGFSAPTESEEISEEFAEFEI